MKRLCFLFCLVSSITFGQREFIDSLLSAIKKPVAQDTMRAFQYNELAWYYLDFDVDSAVYFANKGLQLSKKIGYSNGEFDAMNAKGIILRMQTKYDESIQLYNELIQLREDKGLKEGLTGNYNNLGSAYYEKGSYALALKSYKKSVENAERYNQQDKVLQLYNNLGVAYKSVGLFDLALSTFQDGLKANKKINDSLQQGLLYMNIATVYFEKSMYNDAINYISLSKKSLLAVEANSYLPNLYYNLILSYKQIHDIKNSNKALSEFLKIAQMLKDDFVWSDYYSAQAAIQIESAKFEEALQSTTKALSYLDSELDPLRYAPILIQKGNALRNIGKNKDALETLAKAETVILKTEAQSTLLNCYNSFYETYKLMGDHANALNYLEKANDLQEKLNIESVNNQLATLNSLNELDKKDQELALSNNQNKLYELQNQRQANLIAGLGLIAILIVAMLVIYIRSNIQKKKANRLLSNLNTEINEQKELVEEKQSEILSSIQYAKRIQDSMLANKALIEDYFANSFIFFKPKDIVSGDFYWATELKGKLYVAICDSTGHGVPGAFMAALNSSFLHEAINELQIEDPGKIFDHVRRRLIKTIAHDGVKDGMDGVLICFDKSTNKCSYAAAYNSIFFWKDKEWQTSGLDRMPIGLSEQMEGFQTFDISLSPGDRIYITTDGYVDQFGGQKGKKLKTKGLLEQLESFSALDMEDQGDRIKNFFIKWKSSLDQVDDVCIGGFEVS